MARRVRPQPFAKNPFTSFDEVKLVPIPEAPETHERRRSLRSYLGESSNPIDRLVTTLMGSTPRGPRKVEVVREVPVSEDPTEDPPPPPDAPPARWGRR